MKADVSSLFKPNSKVLDINLTENPVSLSDLPNDVCYTNNIVLSGKLTNVSSVLRFKGRLQFSYQTACARCLSPVFCSHEFGVETDFYPNDSHEAEAYVYIGREIDLSRFVLDNIVFTIPFRHLCSEDCKGLCPQCGKELNTGDCLCKDEYMDPRLAKLKDLLK